ncbi:MAG: 3'-5' exonuclease [Verrucomicrobiota bacterium]
MKTNIMLDIETLGNRPGSAIVWIGAVKFGEGKILDEFYIRINAESCIQIGLQMDTSTVLWWLKQADGPRLEITKPGVDIAVALAEFSKWVADPDACVWGNGAAFDNALLDAAYHAASRRTPWKYSNDRCYRTVKSLHPYIPMERSGEHHHALDDARDQAHHLMDILATTPSTGSTPSIQSESSPSQ